MCDLHMQKKKKLKWLNGLQIVNGEIGIFNLPSCKKTPESFFKQPEEGKA